MPKVKARTNTSTYSARQHFFSKVRDEHLTLLNDLDLRFSYTATADGLRVSSVLRSTSNWCVHGPKANPRHITPVFTSRSMVNPSNCLSPISRAFRFTASSSYRLAVFAGVSASPRGNCGTYPSTGRCGEFGAGSAAPAKALVLKEGKACAAAGGAESDLGCASGSTT